MSDLRRALLRLQLPTPTSICAALGTGRLRRAPRLTARQSPPKPAPKEFPGEGLRCRISDNLFTSRAKRQGLLHKSGPQVAVRQGFSIKPS